MTNLPRRRPRVSSVLVLCFLALGCDSADAPSQAQAGPSASAAPARAPAPSAATGREALAFAAVSGQTTIERDILALQEAVRKAPDKLDNWILLGRAWVQRARQAADPGFFLNARACAEIVLDRSPKNPLAENLVALVLLNDHDFAGAKDAAEQILLTQPDDLQALGTLSDALLELGRIEEAVKAAQQMVDLKPNLPSYSRASYLAWLHGDGARAKEAIRLAIDAGHDVHDKEPRAWCLVQAAMIFWHQGDYPGANAGFDTALQWYPDYPPALVGKGRVDLAEGRPADAVKHFARAYEMAPLVETAWLLSVAKAAAGDAVGAAEMEAKVLDTGKLNDPRTLAAFLANKNREPALALKLAEAEAKKRGGPYTDDVVAWAAYRAGDLDKASEASQRALQYGTKDATLLYHAGAIRLAKGDLAGGQKLLKEALTLNPQFDVVGAKEAAGLLEIAGAAKDATKTP